MAGLNKDKPRAGYDRYLLLGLAAIVLLVVGMGGWAAWASIQGAVISQATVVVESNPKKVQHVEGGIVAELLVREGDHVTAGQLLIRLDETETRSGLAIINAQLNELQARQARLEAERDDAPEIEFPDELVAAAADPKIDRIISGQRKLMSARRTAVSGQKDQLRQRLAQLEEEVVGLKAQQVSKQEQIVLIEQELEALQKLEEQKLVQLNRLLALRREAAQLAGERGQLIADIARAGARIGEAKLAIIQIDQETLKEVLTELRDSQTKIAELLERRLAAETRLRRTKINSPRSGFVHQLNVHTVGGVIRAGEPVMEIIPERDALVLEALVQPQDIDQVIVGQKAFVRMSAFNQRTTPELNGEVIRVSADLMRPTPESPPYYSVRIRLDQQEVERLIGSPLKPGMPAEAFIQTGARTAISYLLKPLTDHVARAFREN